MQVLSAMAGRGTGGTLVWQMPHEVKVRRGKMRPDWGMPSCRDCVVMPFW